MTAQIANTLAEVLKPRGVAVMLEAVHECMSTRGVYKPDVQTVTSRMLGEFRDNEATRREVLAIIGKRRVEIRGVRLRRPPGGREVVQEIGRASVRERVRHVGEISARRLQLKKKKHKIANHI